MAKLKITVELSLPELKFLWAQLNLRVQEQKKYIREHPGDTYLMEYLTRLRATQKLLDRFDIIKTEIDEKYVAGYKIEEGS